MKPLIKWPGGKTRELKNITNLIPSQYSIYIEPFVGGGAVYFHLNSEKNIINDVDFDLTQFYENIKTKEPVFRKCLTFIGKDWETLARYVKPHQADFNSLINKLRQDRSVFSDLSFRNKMISRIVDPITGKGDGLLISINGEFNTYFEQSLSSKLKRIADLEFKHSMEFDQNRLEDHFETSIKAAYYTMLRDEKSNNLQEENASFFFIREYCYGSMFRFNRDGKFNIPYGGIDYNKKSFQLKIDRLQEKSVIKLLAKTEIYNLDFDKFFDQILPLRENDFVFFDPPYDSDFKDYGQQPFRKEDQKRLAKTFATLEGKCVMIINKSEFTFDLYLSMQEMNPKLEITDYEKTYSYNVRGRNNRKAKHLLISNYSQTKKKGKQVRLDSFADF